ncbi:MAG: molybdenum cofactor guanylyltransferase [Actinomycetota bacterium]
MKAQLSGILLAGGSSSRMGADKSDLLFDGEPLARRVAAVLAQTCVEVVVASGDGRRLDWLGLPQVADVIPDAGPLAGLVAGLEVARTELVAVIAVDMPFASPAVLELLAERRDGQDAVVPRSHGGIEPLHAVYARTAAGPLRTALESGEHSVRRALAGMDVLVVEPDEWRAADPTGRFSWNVNRPEDLARLPPGAPGG